MNNEKKHKIDQTIVVKNHDSKKFDYIRCS